MMLKSRFLVPVDAPVIEGGAVVIRDGRIAQVGRARDLASDAVVNFGDAVICPGLVNAHTHLELSGPAGQVPPGDGFVAWLRQVAERSIREEPLRGQVQAAVAAGIDQSVSAGVTLVGDITRHPDWTREILGTSMLRGVSFGEVAAIGNRRDLLATRLDAVCRALRPNSRVRIGISPHAPYTVEPDALRACARRAAEGALPLAIHLAESADEAEFTQYATGPLADHLRELGVWDEQIPQSGCGPVELADRTGVLGPATVIAHANYVTDADIELIAARGASVAYCPRTHDAFMHDPHRFREMMRRGVNVCIGTDSLASNPSLSILDELRSLHRAYPDLSPEDLITLGTLCGARALGFAETAGSITVGKVADLAVLPVSSWKRKADWGHVFDVDDPPIAVYASGVRQGQVAGRKPA